MREDDRIRLRHMLDAARQARSFASGHEGDDLPKDRMLLLSLVKSIEIIGEAASHVTEETRQGLPSISWQDVVGMRNRLIHAYWAVTSEITSHCEEGALRPTWQSPCSRAACPEEIAALAALARNDNCLFDL